MLKQYYPPAELNGFISSILIFKKFTKPIKIFPGTGAEIWVSTKELHLSTAHQQQVSQYQLVIPRVETFTAKPNQGKLIILRVRHDAVRFLLPERTLAYTDNPTSLESIWSEPWYQNLINASFKELLECFTVTKASKQHQLVDDILAILYRHPNKKINDIADEMGYSARFIQKEFVKEYGITPKRYQINCRLEQLLKSMLHEQDTYRWLETGYYDQSHFYRDFKRYFTMTPSAFLKSSYSFFYNTKAKYPLR
ncbi:MULTISPECIES: helix-turn-helix transcriptional regulator [Providencia]|uniref:Helix-turn-helix transcriptional regulator n=1 Tax=Providencia stuartii TaxID=588 RepID=A0AAI9HYX8_PROST|nr:MULTISPECIES: AraC family transcriptional regulator [unclassified Providencia]ELR5035368.1 helix-turn-helix transcriptional regulator [Providencia stuartii]